MEDKYDKTAGKMVKIPTFNSDQSPVPTIGTQKPPPIKNKPYQKQDSTITSLTSKTGFTVATAMTNLDAALEGLIGEDSDLEFDTYTKQKTHKPKTRKTTEHNQMSLVQIGILKEKA